jgi:hypothetical protein
MKLYNISIFFLVSRNPLEIKDTTDTDTSASYLDLHLEIDSEGRLRTRLFQLSYSELSIYSDRCDQQNYKT